MSTFRKIHQGTLRQQHFIPTGDHYESRQVSPSRLCDRTYASEALPNFSKALGADINIYIKRDDLLPGTAGGNKTRKLDFSMADAINQGADTIITCGAVQSNHCRLTLAWPSRKASTATSSLKNA